MSQIELSDTASLAAYEDDIHATTR
jgi:hypothetical protein